MATAGVVKRGGNLRWISPTNVNSGGASEVKLALNWLEIDRSSVGEDMGGVLCRKHFLCRKLNYRSKNVRFSIDFDGESGTPWTTAVGRGLLLIAVHVSSSAIVGVPKTMQLPKTMKLPPRLTASSHVVAHHALTAHREVGAGWEASLQILLNGRVLASSLPSSAASTTQQCPLDNKRSSVLLHRN